MLRFPAAPLASFALLAASLALPGCTPVPNDAGPLPEGERASFAIIDMSAETFCGSFGDSAYMIEGEGDIDAFLLDCAGDHEDQLGEALSSALADKTDDEALVMVTVMLGGCFGDYDIPVVAIDGDTIRPWLIKQDGSYGQPANVQVDCPADIGEALVLLSVADAAEASEVDLTVGLWNADLPGSPYEAHGLNVE